MDICLDQSDGSCNFMLKQIFKWQSVENANQSESGAPFEHGIKPARERGASGGKF